MNIYNVIGTLVKSKILEQNQHKLILKIKYRIYVENKNKNGRKKKLIIQKLKLAHITVIGNGENETAKIFDYRNEQ